MRRGRRRKYDKGGVEKRKWRTNERGGNVNRNKRDKEERENQKAIKDDEEAGLVVVGGGRGREQWWQEKECKKDMDGELQKIPDLYTGY